MNDPTVDLEHQRKLCAGDGVLMPCLGSVDGCPRRFRVAERLIAIGSTFRRSHVVVRGKNSGALSEPLILNAQTDFVACQLVRAVVENPDRDAPIECLRKGMRYPDVFLSGVLGRTELNRADAAQGTVGGHVDGTRLRCHGPKPIQRGGFEAIGKTNEVLLPVRSVPKPRVSECDSE